MIRESTEWWKHMEANSSLMKRFDESRVELEKILKVAQNCLSERGNPEELLKKHTVDLWEDVLVCAQRKKRDGCKYDMTGFCKMFHVTGVLWPARPAGFEYVSQGLRWAHRYFARAGAAVTAGNSQKAAQALEGGYLLIDIMFQVM